MKLLIIGGTRFLGRHLVTAAEARNHEVTLFNRGTLEFPVLKNVETIYGDRNKDLSKLQGRCWDAVIDTCGYLPPTVKSSAEVLSSSINYYVFISSLSVYADVSIPDIDETAPLAILTNEQLQEAIEIDSSGQVSAKTYGELYGGLKVLCEKAVEQVMPNRALIIRPGLIVGSYDYTDRFTYWVMRVARGNEVLAPGRPNRYIQLIDVRDLAEWIVSMIERQKIGIYNASGLSNTNTMEMVLSECKATTKSNASFTWVSDEFLVKENVTPWSEMPLWIPEEEVPLKGFMLINCQKAIASGLSFRPMNDTIQDILTWYKTCCRAEQLKAGLDSNKEQELLHKWHVKNF